MSTLPPQPSYPDHSALRRLIDAHPAIFRGKAPSLHSDLPPGWFGIADVLCTRIEEILGEYTGFFRVDQIKEKFAGLRFYFALDVREMAGAGMGGEGVSGEGGSQAMMSRIAELVREAEGVSIRTCQECGAPGDLARRRGWISTRCDAHLAPGDERAPPEPDERLAAGAGG